MSEFLTPPPAAPDEERATNVRYQILAAATASSIMLYLHRAVLGELFKNAEFNADVPITIDQRPWISGAFFWTYALCQVPAGWLADGFGRRRVLTFYVISWSVFTLLSGAVTGFLSLLALQFLLGIAQAGAYPTCGGIVSRWMPPSRRAFGSAIVSSGGRLGGIINPTLTAVLLALPFLGWRSMLFGYGLVGIAVGVWYWIVARDEPAEHPWCNDAERDRMAEGRPQVAAAKTAVRAPIYEMLTSPMMWCMCVAQFGTNVGWLFVLRDMPTYLKNVKGGSDLDTGLMGSMVWACGFFGMLCGGPLTDYTTRKWGLRWGRIAVTIVTRLIAAGLYFVALETDSAWGTAIVFATITFFCDLGIPAIWAFAQDVGGRSVGAVLAWGNMFGNLGAAVAPLIYAATNKWLGTETTFEGTLYAAIAGFVVSGLACFGINAAKPIVPEKSETPAA